MADMKEQEINLRLLKLVGERLARQTPTWQTYELNMAKFGRAEFDMKQFMKEVSDILDARNAAMKSDAT